jgi:hypothetical protein
MNRKKLIGEVALPFASGVVAGSSVGAVVIHEFVHASLAHAWVGCDDRFRRPATFLANLAGMSVNDYAAGHRRHHAEPNLKPTDSPIDLFRRIREFGSGRSSDTNGGEPILFPDVPVEIDPLYRKTQDSQIVYRHTSRIDQLVAKGLPLMLAPMAAVVVAATYMSDKRQTGLTKSASAATGYFIGASAGALFMAYHEAKAGRAEDGSPLRQPKSKRGQRIVENHLAHHKSPESRQTPAPINRAAQYLLLKTGLTHPLSN